MLFHTNFENPDISQKQIKMKETSKFSHLKDKNRSKLKFTVRSILPTKNNLNKDKSKKIADQEEEVRLFEKEQEEARQYQLELQKQKDSKLEKRRMKRRLYKQKRNKKIKEIKEMKPSEGEIQLIEIVNSIQD